MTNHSDFSAQLPHRPPMLMLTELVQQQGDDIHCRCVISADNPMLEDGRFPAAAGIELLAQAAGLLLGRQAGDGSGNKSGQPPRPGAIVQIKRFTAQPLTLPVGSELQIHAHFEAGSTDAAMFSGEVLLGAEPIFSATLMIALLPAQRPA